MLDPSKRFLTIVLLLGIGVLVAAISFGLREGDRVIGQVTEKRLDSIAPVTVTPEAPPASTSPYGPNWKHTDVMSAAADPQFPDPRVPPEPLPTPPPPPKFKPTPKAATPSPTPTPNMNLPIWRRAKPLPTAMAAPLPSVTGVPGPSESPSPAGTSQP